MSQAHVNRFDGVRGANDLADFRRIVEERRDACPIAPPGLVDRRVVLVPPGLELREHAFGLANRRSAVDALQIGGHFMEKLQQQFEGKLRLKFNLAPPLLAKKDGNGRLLKAEYGSWVWQGFKLLAKLKKLRGTKLDVFGYTAERKMERALIEEYRDTLLFLLTTLTQENLALATEIASLPEKIRGFGHVKEKTVEQYRLERSALLQKYTAPISDVPHAA